MVQRMITGLILFGLTACNQQSPAQPIRDLMVKRVQPTAQVYWDAVQYVSDENGQHNIVPRNDAEWERTRKAAADLAELGQLLKTSTYTEGRGEDWSQFAQGLIAISDQAQKAARTKNTGAVFEAGASIYNVCAACHQVYLPKPTATSKAPTVGEER